MSIENAEIFDSPADIPDPVNPDKLLAGRSDLWAPVQSGLDISTAIPAVELAYVYLSGEVPSPGGMEHARIFFEDFTPTEKLHRAVERYGWNHTSRAILRVILHPDRLQLFDLAEVYDDEVANRDARFPNIENERRFFDGFVRTWGVIKRS